MESHFQKPLEPGPNYRSGVAPGTALVKVLIILIGTHSCVLGLLMLCVPGLMLRLLGFTQPVPPFFPSQSGIFLVILGTCYFMALRRRAFENIILFSKALAVLFLIVHALFFSAPPMVWAAAAGDALMLSAFGGTLLWRGRRNSGPEARAASGSRPDS